jgi:hypothetical protein
MRRAVLLSIVCALALLLFLALLAWLFLPRYSPLAGADGAGAGSGAGVGLSDSAASGGTGTSDGTADRGANTGTGAGGDALGYAEKSGTSSVASAATNPAPGTDATAGALMPAGAPDGQPTADSTAPPADPNLEPPARAPTDEIPPPVPAATPSTGRQVMALGNLQFTDQSASTGDGLAKGGPSGPSFFGSRGKGTKFIYVVDKSGSMMNGRLEAACEELKKSLRSLRTGMSFHVIFYDSTHEEMPGNSLQPVTSTSIDSALRWISRQHPSGGTYPGRAMEIALALKPHTVWLLTDGIFAENVADQIAAANPGQQVSVNTIAFHDASGEAVMKRIAAENRGDYRFVPAPGTGPLQPAKLDRKAEWEKFFGSGSKP